MASTLPLLNSRPTRSSAFVIHLILSLLIFSTLVAVMLVYWFPGDLFIMDGGWEGLKLVALVDLVLGPALTLILFKPGKPGLKLDMALIGTLQLAALGYGFYTTHDQRTVAVVFADREFATVSAKDIREAHQALAKLDIQADELPPATAFSIPQFLTPAAANSGQYLEDILNGYPAAHHRSDQYLPITASNEDMQKHAKSKEYLEMNGTKTLVSKAANKHDLTINQLEIYPFTARFGDGYALYDPAQGRVIDFVSIDPDKIKTAVAENDE